MLHGLQNFFHHRDGFHHRDRDSIAGNARGGYASAATALKAMAA